MRHNDSLDVHESLLQLSGVIAVCAIAVCVIAATLSCLMLGSLRFRSFRSLACWTLSRVIDPDRWSDVDKWDDVRRRLAAWLDARHGETRHGETLNARQETPLEGKRKAGEPAIEPAPLQAFPPVRRRRAYTTYQTEDRLGLVKRANNKDGSRVLAKELKVVRRLCAAADGSHYRSCFPTVFMHGQSDRGLFVVYQSATKCTFTAKQIRQRHPRGVPGEHVAWMFNRMLEAIGFAHQRGTVHAAVMPQHLLFDCHAHGLQLTDWTHAKRIGQPVSFVPRRYRTWYPATPLVRAEPGLDIYMAARSARYLAGANASERACPETLPRPIDRFLQSCLIESNRMRPSDAWQLHEEFAELSETVYGEPRVCSLSMF